MEENWSEGNYSSGKENAEENGSAKENRAEEYDSAGKNGSEKCMTLEEFSNEKKCSAEENVSESDESMEEYFIEEESWEIESNSEEEEYSKEYSSEEEYSSELNCSVEEEYSKEYSSEEEYSMEEEYSKEYFSEEEYSMELNCSPDENTLFKRIQEELRKLSFVEEHGLKFEVTTLRKEICVVEIVAVGSIDCGKTQLIKSVFGDHPSFEVEHQDGRDEYRIYLSKHKNMFVHIWIYDMKDAEVARKEDFRMKTVVFFCYAVDDLESLLSLEKMWIPAISGIRMFPFLVGIESDPNTKPKTTSGTNTLKEKMAIHKKAGELSLQLHRAGFLYCSLGRKSSMLDVFQNAINAVYPLTSR